MRVHTPKIIDELLIQEAKEQDVPVSDIVSQRLAAAYDIKLKPVRSRSQGNPYETSNH